VAAYLRGDTEGKPAPEKILERLAAPTAPVPATVKAETEEKSTVDQSKLEALTKPVEAAAPKRVETEKPEEIEKANEKLAGLMKPKE
jgi:hypothetical protein